MLLSGWLKEALSGWLDGLNEPRYVYALMALRMTSHLRLGRVDASRPSAARTIGNRTAQRRSRPERRPQIPMGDRIPPLHPRRRGQGLPRARTLEQLPSPFHGADVGRHRKDARGTGRGGGCALPSVIPAIVLTHYTRQVRGQHYDLVLNGVEIGGGSVRVHDAAMQDYIFTNILQVSAVRYMATRKLNVRVRQLDEKEKSSFNHLLHALRCGAPPHGGFAFGECHIPRARVAALTSGAQASTDSWPSSARQRLSGTSSPSPRPLRGQTYSLRARRHLPPKCSRNTHSAH